MEEKPIIINRGKIVYLLYPHKVIVGNGGGQWTSYNQYYNWNRQGITLFRNTILNSKDHEYNNPVDQMSLAYQCGIRGTGTQKPDEIE